MNYSTYCYSNNNPISLNDPLGLKPGFPGEAPAELQEVVVTSSRKAKSAVLNAALWITNNNSGQTRLGRFMRKYGSHFSGVGNNISNLYDLGVNSMLRRNMGWLTGDILNMVKNEPEMKRH